MYRASRLAGLALLALLGCDSGSPTEPAESEVLLGALFSLTGNWSTLGQTSQVAVEIAVEEVNRYLEGNAAGVRFKVAVEDTRLEPERALERAQALHSRGARILIGPQSSAEVAYLKPWVDANGLLLVSHGSTAGNLAIPGDNVFRFTPSDVPEGAAVSAMMWEDGIRTLVPVWRDDAGNAGLEAATRTAFSALGGSVLAGVKYGDAISDHSPTVEALRAQVLDAIAQQGQAQVGVYLAAFDEVVHLFISASTDAVLGSVRWYGSNGVALSEALLDDPVAVEFAIRTGYPNPVFGRDEGAREIWEPIVAQIRARTGLEPDGFALAVYDAVWVVARAYIASGATDDVERLKQAFTTAAASGYGATGWTVLDEAGDRKYGDFDFWAVGDEAGVPRWTRVARYESRTGRLVR
ncbi:MAG TPA: ABC transporter substrate-binding protein [Longimicrobiales bacterium]|nr:ABC transporter substrate-binding protein [Longimicrobiales bacterium]